MKIQFSQVILMKMMIQFKKERLPKVNFQLLGGVVFLVGSFLFGVGVLSMLENAKIGFQLKSAWQHSNSKTLQIHKGKKQIRFWVNFNAIMFTPKRNTLFAHKKRTKRSPTYYFHQAGVKPPDVPSDGFIHPYVSHLHCQIQSPLDLKNCREWILFVPDG